MPQKAMPWTAAMEQYLSNRPDEWVSKDEVLAVGAELVPEDVARAEMSKRPGKLSEQKMLSAGKRSKAQQALMGRVRFGHIKESGDRKMVMWLGSEAFSLGDVGRRVVKLEELPDRVEALEAQVQFLVDKLTGETSAGVEEFFAAAGIGAE